MAGYDRDADRVALLEAILSHAAFDGWSQTAFDAGAREAGIPADRALNAFPGGMAEVLAFHNEIADRLIVLRDGKIVEDRDTAVPPAGA